MSAFDKKSDDQAIGIHAFYSPAFANIRTFRRIYPHALVDRMFPKRKLKRYFSDFMTIAAV